MSNPSVFDLAGLHVSGCIPQTSKLSVRIHISITIIYSPKNVSLFSATLDEVLEVALRY